MPMGNELCYGKAVGTDSFWVADPATRLGNTQEQYAQETRMKYAGLSMNLRNSDFLLITGASTKKR